MNTRTLVGAVLIASCLTPSFVSAADWATVSAGPGSSRHPERAVNDGSGGVYFSWNEVTGTSSFNLRLTRITDAGVQAAGWPAGGSIPTVTDERRGYSQLLADGEGGVFVGWHRLGPTGGTTYDVYVQRLTGANQIAPGWPNQGVLVAGVTPKTSSLGMVSDGAGGVYLTWFAKVANGDFRVFAQRITGAGTVAAGWPAGGLAVSTTLNNQLFIRGCSDGQGGLLVVWSEGPSGGPFDLYAQHLLPDGTRAWPSTGVAVCTDAADQRGYQLESWMVSDGAGGFICAWTDSRNGNRDIYAQRMTGSGSVASGWPVDGLALTTAAGDQVDALIETDDASGAYVVWNDYSKNSDPNTTDQTDVYAHHVLANGTLAAGWPAGGYGLSTQPFYQDRPRIARDGQGGAYFVWHDWPRGVVATRINSSGVVYPGWTTLGGEDIGAMNSSDSNCPLLHPSGDLIIGYEDSRDHYAARTFGTGFPQPTSVDPRTALSGKIDVAPHPVADRAEFSFALRGGLPATLELFAIDGRRMWQREVASLGAGRHTVPFAASATLPAGVYRLRLTEGTTSVTRALVRVR